MTRPFKRVFRGDWRLSRGRPWRAAFCRWRPSRKCPSGSPASAARATSRAKGTGIGGTGYQPGEGNGIGGTGTPQTRAEATGIIGTITGFGSIFVNNYEVDYTANTPAKSDLGEVLDAKSL